MVDFMTRPPVLILLCALSYATATLAMKAYSVTFALPALLGLAICLALAVVAEVVLMRQLSVGIIYVLVIATETLVVLSAAYIIGEGLNLRELLGAGLIIGGAAIVAH